MVGGHSEPRDEHGYEQERVARRDGRQGDAHARQQDAAGQEPHGASAIRPEPEGRLDDRGAERRHEHDGPDEGVREIELVREEHEQSRHCTLRQIDGEVSRGEAGHATPVDARRPPPTSHARSIARPLRRSGRQPVSGRAREPPEARSGCRGLRAVALDERVGKLPLRLHDGDAIPFELRGPGSAGAQLLPFPDQPSEEILEGFDWERRLPAGVPDGLGRCACGAYSRPLRISARSFHD